MGAPLPVYIILGHGTEVDTNFNDRSTLSPNRTLVTFSESSQTTTHDEVCKFLDIFSNAANGELVSSPVAWKTDVENDIKSGIHIYKAGMKIPNLKITPLAYWDFNINMPGAEVGYQFVPSGVYEFPLNLDSFDDPFHKLSPNIKENFLQRFAKSLRVCRNKILYTDNIHTDEDLVRKIYSNSVYPTADEILEKYPDINYSTFRNLGNDYEITINDLMDKLGDGIYYYVICRADNTIYSLNFNEMKLYLFGNNSNALYIGYFLEDINIDGNTLIGEEGSQRTIIDVLTELYEIGKQYKDILESKNLVLPFTKFIEYLNILKTGFTTGDFRYLPNLIVSELFQSLDDLKTPEAWDKLIEKYTNIRQKLMFKRRMSTVQQSKIYDGGKRKYKKTKKNKRKAPRKTRRH